MLPQETVQAWNTSLKDPRLQAGVFGEFSGAEKPEARAGGSVILNLLRGQGLERTLGALEAFDKPNDPFNDAMNRPFTKDNQESFDKIFNVINGLVEDPTQIQDFNQFRAGGKELVPGRQRIGRQDFFKVDDSIESGNAAEIQRVLKAKGFDPGEIDGYFGGKSKEALKKFQAANGLKVDGIPGPNTREVLFNAK